MPKSQSKRAIEGRKWRASARERRRLNTVVTEYVRLKHATIYEECSNLYISILKNYSEKQNLTKTREFRELIGDYTQAGKPCVSSNEVHEPANKAVHEPANNDDEPANKAVHQPANNDDEPANKAVHEPANNDDEPANKAVHEPANNDDEPANKAVHDEAVHDEAVHEAVHDETVHDEAVYDEAASIGDTYVEPGLIMNNYIVYHQTDILTEAMNETIGDDEYDCIDRTEDMDTIVNEIINDLEAVEPDIFLPSTAEDEGIGLNVEDEVDDLFYDLDIDVDDYNLW